MKNKTSKGRMCKDFRDTAYVLLLTMMATLVGCRDVSTPKPHGYLRITMPSHEYTPMEVDSLPYTFEKAKISYIEKDKSKGAAPEWYNIYYPTLRCKIHITYLEMPSDSMDMMLEDNHRLVYKHTVMADAIGERDYMDENGRVYATIYDIKGNAATPTQFAITDSLGRLFRGSLYFNCRPNKDSLSPMIEYLDADIMHIIETFGWKKPNKPLVAVCH